MSVLKEKDMDDTKLQRVTFEQAKVLREKGFDWVCDGRYRRYVGIFTRLPILTNYNDSSEFVSAPTVVEALKWFRDEKHFMTGIQFDTLIKAYVVRLGLENWEGNHKTWDEAENALLDKMLKGTIVYQ